MQSEMEPSPGEPGTKPDAGIQISTVRSSSASEALDIHQPGAQAYGGYSGDHQPASKIASVPTTGKVADSYLKKLILNVESEDRVWGMVNIGVTILEL